MRLWTNTDTFGGGFSPIVIDASDLSAIWVMISGPAGTVVTITGVLTMGTITIANAVPIGASGFMFVAFSRATLIGANANWSPAAGAFAAQLPLPGSLTFAANNQCTAEWCGWKDEAG